MWLKTIYYWIIALQHPNIITRFFVPNKKWTVIAAGDNIFAISKIKISCIFIKFLTIYYSTFKKFWKILKNLEFSGRQFMKKKVFLQKSNEPAEKIRFFNVRRRIAMATKSLLEIVGSITKFHLLSFACRLNWMVMKFVLRIVAAFFVTFIIDFHRIISFRWFSTFSFFTFFLFRCCKKNWCDQSKVVHKFPTRTYHWKQQFSEKTWK